ADCTARRGKPNSKSRFARRTTRISLPIRCFQFPLPRGQIFREITMRRFSRSGALTTTAFLLAVSIVPLSAKEPPGAVPNLTGPWQNANNFKLIPVPGSPRPVDDLEGYVHHERGVDAKGNDYSTNAYIGDYKNSLLTAWGQAALKKEAEEAI